MKKPCKQCPYRKTSAPGYLGESSHDPQRFLQQLDLPTSHPCHNTVDWDEEDYNKAKVCIGALQFMNNSAKLSRNPELKTLQSSLGKNDELFNWSSEFIKHHSK